MIHASRTLAITAAVACVTLGVVLVAIVERADAQAVNSTPSRKTLEDSSADNCEGVSLVVKRCDPKPADPAAKPAADSLARSRAQTKAAFDARDKRARDQAVQGGPQPVNSPVGDAERLGGVTVTGRATEAPKVEEVIQKALEKPTVSPNGTVSKYAPNGTRYDCIEKCVGPACCVEVRALPNPARDVNSIGH